MRKTVDIDYLSDMPVATRERFRAAVQKYFPEIQYVRAGLSYTDYSLYSLNLRMVAIMGEFDLYDVGHELTHYLQDKRNRETGWVVGGVVPMRGEKQCDIYTMARHVDLVPNVWKGNPCYVRIPAQFRMADEAIGRQVLHNAAQQATEGGLGARSRLVHNFELELKRIARRM